jgi:hypothetical protein
MSAGCVICRFASRHVPWLAICVQMKPSECLNLDAVIEMALIKCTVKPLKEHVYRLYAYDYTRSADEFLLPICMHNFALVRYCTGWRRMRNGFDLLTGRG